jgi:MFS family permease
MYTNEELISAVKAGIFTEEAVTSFQKHTEQLRQQASVDEENFQLLTGFNDIFVVIACLLVLVSVSWFGATINDLTGALCVTVTSWGLAEFFVLKRRMALPAIVLLLSFIGGVVASSLAIFGGLSEVSLLASAVITAIAAWFHWRRFQVPITVAAGAAATIGCIIAITVATSSEAKNWMLPILFISGLSLFIYAMVWDSSDRLRKTRQSDVAFWLHLVAAPMIVHPIFSILGILEGQSGLVEASLVIGLYLLMAVVSIAIDRRAIMVSGLAYVLYAFSTLLQTYGLQGSSSAITGIFIGSALLLLSVYWHGCRTVLFKLIPSSLQRFLPPLK